MPLGESLPTAYIGESKLAIGEPSFYENLLNNFGKGLVLYSFKGFLSTIRHLVYLDPEAHAMPQWSPNLGSLSVRGPKKLAHNAFLVCVIIMYWG
jgi:hypothetical protein